MNRGQFLKRVAGVALVAAVPEVLLKSPVGGANAEPLPLEHMTPMMLGGDFLKTDGKYFRSGDIIRNCSTGEAMFVTAIVANGIRVQRGYGSLPPQPVTSGDAGLIIAGMSGEGEPLEPVCMRGQSTHHWSEDAFMPRFFQFT